jgi:hypothetical protein
LGNFTREIAPLLEARDCDQLSGIAVRGPNWSRSSGSDIGGNDIVGIYRVDGPDSFTVVADIGAFSLGNPPNTPFDIPTGV